MRLSPEIIRAITGRKQRTELAHTDQATTRGYLLWRETPVYEVVMRPLDAAACQLATICASCRDPRIERNELLVSRPPDTRPGNNL